MDFLISATQISAVYLMGLGFLIGIMGGFFGVGVVFWQDQPCLLRECQ